jgi:hypothetical protein
VLHDISRILANLLVFKRLKYLDLHPLFEAKSFQILLKCRYCCRSGKVIAGLRSDTPIDPNVASENCIQHLLFVFIFTFCEKCYGSINYLFSCAWQWSFLVMAEQNQTYYRRKNTHATRKALPIRNSAWFTQPFNCLVSKNFTQSSSDIKQLHA